MQTGVLRASQGRSVWVAGDLYTIKASGADTGGAFALIEAMVPPGGGPPPHIHHREDEAFYVLEGDLQFHADGRSFAAGAGSWVTLARGSLHHFKNVGSAPARMLIVVTPSGLEQFFLEVGKEAGADDIGMVVSTPEDLETLLAVAMNYGMEIRPPSP